MGDLSYELKPGDRVKDNDPRRPYARYLTIVEILPNGVWATDGKRTFGVLRHRIYTDGKPRKNGFSLVVGGAP